MKMRIILRISELEENTLKYTKLVAIMYASCGSLESVYPAVVSVGERRGPRTIRGVLRHPFSWKRTADSVTNGYGGEDEERGKQ